MNGNIIEVSLSHIQVLDNYQVGYKQGFKDGFEQGEQAAEDQVIHDYNQRILKKLGTEQPTADEAIAEINATLATNLAAKGVPAEATETTAELAERVADITDPQEAYQEGYDVGFDKGSKDGWIYEWARQCTYAGSLSDAEISEIGDLYFEKATGIATDLFYGNNFLTRVGNITAPVEAGGKGVGNIFRDCKNLISVGNITLNRNRTPSSYVSIGGMFRNCTVLQTVGFIDAPTYDKIDYLFADCNELTTLGGFNSSHWTNGQSVFAYCYKLREITHPIDFTSCTSAGEMFRYCGALEEVRFVEGTIKVSLGYFYGCGSLSDASIQSWVDGLADLTGQTAVTQQLHADVKARMTEAQIATVTGKNWTIA